MDEKKTTPKKTNILAIVLIVIFATLTLFSIGSYVIYKKAKSTVMNTIDNTKTTLNDTTAESEAIQAEIRKVAQQSMDGELTQAEAQAKLRELNARSLNLLKK